MYPPAPPNRNVDNSGRANDHDCGNGQTATPQTSTFEWYGVSFCYKFFIDHRTQLTLTLFFVPFFGTGYFEKNAHLQKRLENIAPASSRRLRV